MHTPSFINISSSRCEPPPSLSHNTLTLHIKNGSTDSQNQASPASESSQQSHHQWVYRQRHYQRTSPCNTSSSSYLRLRESSRPPTPYSAACSCAPANHEPATVLSTRWTSRCNCVTVPTPSLRDSNPEDIHRLDARRSRPAAFVRSWKLRKVG